MPTLRIPVLVPSPIDFNGEDTPTAMNIEEITYTYKDVQRLIGDIQKELYAIAEHHASIPEQLQCIVSRNDLIAINWYIQERNRYNQPYLYERNQLILQTPFGSLRFVEGYVGDPVIAHMP